MFNLQMEGTDVYQGDGENLTETLSFILKP